MTERGEECDIAPLTLAERNDRQRLLLLLLLTLFSIVLPQGIPNKYGGNLGKKPVGFLAIGPTLLVPLVPIHVLGRRPHYSCTATNPFTSVLAAFFASCFTAFASSAILVA
jgi:hypothetical protein